MKIPRSRFGSSMGDEESQGAPQADADRCLETVSQSHRCILIHSQHSEDVCITVPRTHMARVSVCEPWCGAGPGNEHSHVSREFHVWSVEHGVSWVLNASDNIVKGHSVGQQPGVWVTPMIDTATWYARPQVVFGDGVYYRVVWQVLVNPDKRREYKKESGSSIVSARTMFESSRCGSSRTPPRWNRRGNSFRSGTRITRPFL